MIARRDWGLFGGKIGRMNVRRVGGWFGADFGRKNARRQRMGFYVSKRDGR